MTEQKEIKWLKEYSNGRKELKENALKNNSLPDIANFDLEFWKKIYEEGKQAGATENGVQWHDLRKDPNDLPYTEINDTERKVIVMRENDIIDFDKYFKSWGWQKEVLRRTIDKVIAWCEIPQFKE